MSEYSVEQVREEADGCGLLTRKRLMLRAYADLLERIKADEAAKPFAWWRIVQPGGVVIQADRPAEWNGSAIPLFTHPPAQAAQVDAAEQAIGWFHGEFGDLNPATACLVWNFALALGNKLADAEKKYGYTDGWRSPDWMDECRTKLMEHIAKGDPRDVAAYCAFLWHHGASTAPTAEPVAQGEAVAPNGYHYVYPDIWGTGEVIRKNGGREVDGIKPLRAIPYWYTSPAQPRAVPDGWKAVTSALVSAAELMISEIDTCGHEVDPAYRLHLYEAKDAAKALLAAAPSPGESNAATKEADR